MGMISTQVEGKKASTETDDGEARKRLASGTMLLQTKDDLQFRSPASPSGAQYKGDSKGRRPAEVFRTDFITAMKIPDNQTLPAGRHYELVDAWRQEWERGVQVPVNPEVLPKTSVRKKDLHSQSKGHDAFSLPKTRITNDCPELVHANDKTVGCSYDLDDLDVHWLQLTKSTTKKLGGNIDECVMERAMAFFERKCFENMAHAVATKKGLSIEYDDSTTCDICLSPDTEDSNEIVFCDACNMCVHQACYGIPEIPVGTWLCRPCSRGVLAPPCIICPNRGGALKRVKNSFEWIHVICAWWVPEVKIEDIDNVEKMTVDKIPTSRKNLCCSLCREKVGACIQCSVKRCVAAYHVTCAVKEGLEMKTVMMQEKDDVQHISYCKRHCIPQPPEKNKQRPGDNVENQRLHELQKLQEEFFKLVDVRSSARELRLTRNVTAKLFGYWVLKRKANENRPLVPLTTEQQEKLSGKQGIYLIQEQINVEMERYALLRQDLERLRNLCYLIIRRERTKREVHKASQDVFYKQEEILNAEGASMSDDDFKRIASGDELMRFTKFAHYASDGPPYADHIGDDDLQGSNTPITSNVPSEQEVNVVDSEKEVSHQFLSKEDEVTSSNNDKCDILSQGEMVSDCSQNDITSCSEEQSSNLPVVRVAGDDSCVQSGIENGIKDEEGYIEEKYIDVKKLNGGNQLVDVPSNLEVKITRTEALERSSEVKSLVQQVRMKERIVEGGTPGIRENKTYESKNNLIHANCVSVTARDPISREVEKEGFLIEPKQMIDDTCTDLVISIHEMQKHGNIDKQKDFNLDSPNRTNSPEITNPRRESKRKQSASSQTRRILRTSARLKGIHLDNDDRHIAVDSHSINGERPLLRSLAGTDHLVGYQRPDLGENEAVSSSDNGMCSSRVEGKETSMEVVVRHEIENHVDAASELERGLQKDACNPQDMNCPQDANCPQDKHHSQNMNASQHSPITSETNTVQDIICSQGTGWPVGTKSSQDRSLSLDKKGSPKSPIHLSQSNNLDIALKDKQEQHQTVLDSLRPKSLVDRIQKDLKVVGTSSDIAGSHAVGTSSDGSEWHSVADNHADAGTKNDFVQGSKEATSRTDGMTQECPNSTHVGSSLENVSSKVGNYKNPCAVDIDFFNHHEEKPSNSPLCDVPLDENNDRKSTELNREGSKLIAQSSKVLPAVSVSKPKVKENCYIDKVGSLQGKVSDTGLEEMDAHILASSSAKRTEHVKKKQSTLCNDLSVYIEDRISNNDADYPGSGPTSVCDVKQRSKVKPSSIDCCDGQLTQKLKRGHFNAKLRRMNEELPDTRNIFEAMDFGDANRNPVVLLNELSNLNDITKKRPCSLNGINESPRKSKKSGDIPSPAFPHSVIDDLVACPQRLTRGRTQLMMMDQCEGNASRKRNKKRRRTVCDTRNEADVVVALSEADSLVENFWPQRLTRKRLRSLGFEKSNLPDLDLINGLSKEQPSLMLNEKSAKFCNNMSTARKDDLIEESSKTNSIDEPVVSPTRLTRSRIKSLGLERNIEDLVFV